VSTPRLINSLLVQHLEVETISQTFLWSEVPVPPSLRALLHIGDCSCDFVPSERFVSWLVTPCEAREGFLSEYATGVLLTERLALPSSVASDGTDSLSPNGVTKRCVFLKATYLLHPDLPGTSMMQYLCNEHAIARCVLLFVCLLAGLLAGLVWFGLVWFGLVMFGLVWFGLVWFGLVWFGLFVCFCVCVCL
jgi:hypothetical protein